MEEIKPIKRCKELAPLSREHHDGLLFSWKIKEGLANETPVEKICAYTRWFWTNHLKSHFEEEEKAMTKFLPEDNPLLRQMFNEHAQVKEIIISLEKEPNANSLEILADLIKNHIRFEERKLFAFVEERLTPGQLSEIAKELTHAPQCNTDPLAMRWKDEFWIRKPKTL